MNQTMYTHAQKRTSGFTLIEMLVSLSIFLIVVTMSVGTLLVLIDANGRAQSMQLVMTNLSFALDSLTREMRTGYNWYCDSEGIGDFPDPPGGSALRDCSTGGNYVSIIESGNSLTEGLTTRRITYYFNQEAGRIERKLGTGNERPWVPLTPPEVTIEEMEFVVTGTDRHGDTGDTEQPTATIYLRGSAGTTEANTATFEIQTTVSQRTFDI